ncbi:hypothetical protein ASG59_15845 [Methylobacterium sp. Leaf466]|nr:hypothetical protein ASG59_15845 [Methylobacterium sp. Leaf466]
MVPSRLRASLLMIRYSRRPTTAPITDGAGPLPLRGGGSGRRLMRARSSKNSSPAMMPWDGAGPLPLRGGGSGRRLMRARSSKNSSPAMMPSLGAVRLMTLSSSNSRPARRPVK